MIDGREIEKDAGGGCQRMVFIGEDVFQTDDYAMEGAGASPCPSFCIQAAGFFQRFVPVYLDISVEVLISCDPVKIMPYCVFAGA
jgi:hypothetical protein